METKIKDRIVNYWTKRSENFAQLRQEELHSYMSELWLTEITKYLPQRPCKILDVGTGSGFFAQLLAKHHHEVDGIDLTHSMIEQAKLSLKAYRVTLLSLRRRTRGNPRARMGWLPIPFHKK